MEMVGPRSVVDVGCGLGTWLEAFLERGVETVVGVDGNWVDGDALRIPSADFRRLDLEKPIDLEQTFDLAVSLEVAEHIQPERAAQFVASLARLAPVVLFSAAIPYQGGTHHVNERWPSYWVELFAERDLHALDAVRPRIWNRDDVDYWYCQNTILFATEAAMERFPADLRAAPAPLDIVHPRQLLALASAWQRAADPRHAGLREILRALPQVASRSLARRLGRDPAAR